jgi:hypothetical protein
MTEIEREEEQLTNNLSRKLTRERAEKEALEARLLSERKQVRLCENPKISDRLFTFVL